MPRRPCTFRQRDVKAAIVAAETAGKQVAAVRINPQGEIEIVFRKTDAQQLTSNEWDDELFHGTDQTQTR